MQKSVFSLLLFFVTVAVSGQSYLMERGQSLKVKQAIPVKAYAFQPGAVALLPGSPFYHARQLDSAYLMLIKPDRLLHRFHRNAGLSIKDSVYGGWESEGLSGHTLGHYLSASALLFATSKSANLKSRIDYTVSELAKCQQARGTGYIGAIPNEDSIFAQVSRGLIKSSGFDLNGGWSPWYTVHKVLAGLLDAYLYAGNKQALEVAKGLGNWTWKTIGHLPDSTRLKMLNCEYGGMNESLANLYAITGDALYLKTARLFYDEFVMGKLARGIDPLPGKHSNTNVPKAIGSARLHELTGSRQDSTIAHFFWQTMTSNHTYVIGGNSNYEYCGDQGKLSDRLSDNTCETCNTYNMLKLTRHLFTWSPDSKLGDYDERALYNHILASQHSKTGMTTYFMPLRMGTKKTFSDSFNTFTCCVGSGMENHVRYEEGIYFEGEDASLYINQFIASTLHWERLGVELEQKTAFPESNSTSITIRSRQKKSFSILIRKPIWVKQKITVQLNGKAINYSETAEGYLRIHRTWQSGDKLEIEFPMHLYTEAMPDNPNRIALLYGPIVLAGTLGREMPDPVFGTPVLMTEERDPSKWTKPVSGQPLHFQWTSAGKPNDVYLQPFYSVSDDYYSVYWDYFTPAKWTEREQEYMEEKARLAAIEKRVIDRFRVGEMQPERDHQLVATERSYVSDALGRMGREARTGHRFNFSMRVEPSADNQLIITMIGDDKDRKFDLLADGVLIKTVDWKGGQTGRFYDMEFPIPAELTRNKTHINIIVEANHGKTAGRLFGVATLREKNKE